MTFETSHACLVDETSEIACIQTRYQEGLITSVECMFATLTAVHNATQHLQTILNLVKAEVSK